MKISFFFENYVPGGASKYLVDCINACRLLVGSEIVLISNAGGLSDYELAQINTVFINETIGVCERLKIIERYFGRGLASKLISKSLVYVSPLILLINTAHIFFRLIKNRPDILFSINGGYPGADSALAAVLAGRILRIPVVLVILSQPRPRRYVIPGYEYILDFAVLKSANLVIANSKFAADLLVNERNVLPRKVQVLYNGIEDVKEIRGYIQNRTSKIVLGIVCRLDPMKGLDDLLVAFKRLSSRPELELRIVGDGESLESLQALTHQLGIADKVSFVGFKSGVSLAEEYIKFDIFVFPSYWEGLPYSILEAMRAGLPIIATNVGGIPEAISHMKEGLLIPVRSSNDIYVAIAKLLDNPDLALSLGRAARLKFESTFSIDKMHSNFVALFDLSVDGT